jgi:SAM-dependent methyltransferase
VTVTTTLESAYFDDMYSASTDPWGFESRWYERRKYALSLALLPAERYAAALEPGCSIGVFTRQLASRCDSVLACDGAAAAVRAARTRTGDLGHVQVQHRSLPRDWPDGTFDLIVLSELLYYFSDHDLGEVLDAATSALRPGGTLLAVHWRHSVPEYPRSGDDVHAVLARRPGLARLTSLREPDFLAEVYLRGEPPAVSVAAATGLL